MPTNKDKKIKALKKQLTSDKAFLCPSGKLEEQDIRIEARDWCGPIDTDRGASENQVENLALHFYSKGRDELKSQLSQKEKQLEKVKDNLKTSQYWLKKAQKRIGMLEEEIKHLQRNAKQKTKPSED